MHHNRRWIGILLVLIGAASYGMLSPLTKLAFQGGWNEAQVTFMQLTCGVVMMWGIVGLRPGAWSNPFRGPWVRLSLIGMIGLALTTVLYNTALSELDASLAIVMLFQFTWITLALDSILQRKKPNLFQLLSVGTVMVGTLLTVNIASANFSTVSLRGIGFGLLAAVTYSLFILFTGKLQTKMDPVLRSAIMLTAGLPLLYLIYPPQQVLQGDISSLLLWGLVLGIFGQIIPTVGFNIGVPRTGSSLAAMLGSMELPVAVIGAYVILHESVKLQQWIGIGLILAGVVIAELKTAKLRNRG